MRKLSLILSFLAALSLSLWAWAPLRAENVVGNPNLVQCNRTQPFTGTGAAAVVVAGTLNKTTFICGWHITNTAATGTFAITAGTGTNCGTNTVSVTPAMSITSTAPSTDHIEYAGTSAGLSADLCVSATVTTVTGIIWYGQY